MGMDRYHNLSGAGQALATALGPRDHAVVLALPGRSVPVAAEVARLLHLPLDLFVVRSLPVPGEEQLTMGAVASGGERVLDSKLAASVPFDDIDRAIAREEEEVVRVEKELRGGKHRQPLSGRVAILVAEGVRSGETLRAAAAAIRQARSARIVLATPVGDAGTLAELAADADEVVCPMKIEKLERIEDFYEECPEPSAEAMRALLASATP